MDELIKLIDPISKTQILTVVDYYTLTGKDENGNLFTSKMHAPYIASKIIEGKLSAEIPVPLQPT
jgi:hypothetical protein